MRDSELFKDLKGYFVFHVKKRLCAFKERAGVQLTTLYRDNDLRQLICDRVADFEL